VESIEILGAMHARRSMLEKWENFFQLISTLLLRSEERFCRPLKKCSFEVNYLVLGGDQQIFYKVFSPKNICRTRGIILVIVLRFLWGKEIREVFV
jgi:hypothetical protein